ncbi:hypothetical protein [Acinetobacter baylyi]|uniref:hypothetical protein n=1 Tax=Acinetobacter baylyi TaxID=202950 RepID=UPI0031E33C4A
MLSSAFVGKNLSLNRARYNLSDFLLTIFLYTSIVLPSGDILGLNVKIIFLLLFIFSLFKNDKVISSIIFSLLPIVLFLLLEILYAYFSIKFDSSYILTQSKDILVFFIVFYILRSYALHTDGFNFLIEKIVNAIFVVGVIKFLILFYSFLTGLPVSFIVKTIGEFFNVSIMSFDVDNSSLSRINFTSDSLIAIVIFYLISKFFKNHNNRIDILKIIIILFSALITMSRFQWLACVISILLAMLINLKSVRSFFALLMFVGVSIFSLSLNSVQELISTRFDSRLVDASDLERIVQKQKIIEHIDSATFFGNGIGYYIPELIRSDIAKYSYELQLPALVMQVGVIGTTVIMLFILLPLLKSMKGMSNMSLISLGIIVFIWLYGAMFNPILFSSSAGAAMVAIYSISKVSWMRS